MMTTVMSMLIVPILLGALNARVEPDLKEVAYFVEVYVKIKFNGIKIFVSQFTQIVVLCYMRIIHGQTICLSCNLCECIYRILFLTWMHCRML